MGKCYTGLYDESSTREWCEEQLKIERIRNMVKDGNDAGDSCIAGKNCSPVLRNINAEDRSRESTGVQRLGDSPQGVAVDEEKDSSRINIYSDDLGLPPYEGSSCQKASQVADRCCGRPETCMGEPSVDESKDDTIGGQIVGLLGSTALSLPGSVSQMCGRMKSVGMAMTALNGYLAAKCQSKVAQCRSACSEPAKRVQAAIKAAETKSDVATIERRYYDYISADSVCDSSNNASWKMAQQAVGNQLGSKFADMCKQATSTNPNAEEDAFASTNCNTPSAATTPMCQSYCTRPGGRNDPNCAGYYAAIGNGQNGNGRSETSASNSSLFNIPNDPEGDQFADPQDVEAVGRKAPTTGGGGGVSLGGGGDGGGGGGDYGSGGGGGDGYNTKIDRGLNSGNGYSVGSMRVGGGGGFSGYGSGGAITDKGGKPFSLKDFLPGGDKNKVKFRGLASALPDVSPAHTDIFKKVSDRFFQICQRDALYDCSTLKKMKRTGN
jgi:hypothetical protein